MAHNQYRRENLYKIIVQYDHPDGGPAFAKYRNIEVDKPASWKRTADFLKRRFPSMHHVNVYGGISQEFVKQIKRDEL
jgi:hypothetical protein